MVDIFPEVDLSTPASIEVSEVFLPWQLPNYKGETPFRRPKNPYSTKQATAPDPANPRKSIQSFSRTRFLEFDSEGGLKKPIERASKDQISVAPIPEMCAKRLSAMSNQRKLTEEEIPPGVEYLDWCSEIPPYVYIAISDLTDKDHSLFMPTFSHTYRDGLAAIDLSEITSWTPGSKIMINGFVWEGDSGSSKGDTGLASGHVASNGRVIADNRIGGGFSSSTPGKSAGNKLVFRWSAEGTYSWEENSESKTYDLSVYQGHVSSSTSIVKSGACATDSLVSRWSAIGTTEHGSLVFVSSTSTGETSAAELCAVLKAVGVTNAIRLDGGPSAAMVVNNKLLNPLKGAYEFLYGTSRRIAYGLRFARGGS